MSGTNLFHRRTSLAVTESDLHSQVPEAEHEISVYIYTVDYSGYFTFLMTVGTRVFIASQVKEAQTATSKIQNVQLLSEVCYVWFYQ